MGHLTDFSRLLARQVFICVLVVHKKDLTQFSEREKPASGGPKQHICFVPALDPINQIARRTAPCRMSCFDPSSDPLLAGSALASSRILN